MPEAASSSTSTPSLEDWLKIGGGIALALYVIGLLSVNGYLFSLGVSDFSLVRPRFVYTGALICAVAAFCYFVPVYSLDILAKAWNSGEGSTKREKLRSSFRDGSLHPGNVGFVLMPAMIAFLFFSFVPEFGHDTSSAKDIALGVILATSILVVGLTIRGMNSHIQNTAEQDGVKSAHMVLDLAMTLFLFAIGLAIIVAILYSRVPEQFGGGRPKTASILFKDDQKAAAHQLNIQLVSDTLSVPVPLIYEGSEVYVVRGSTGSIIQLKKDIVAAIITGSA